MTSSVLNLDQSPAELNRVYETNYYAYLNSPEFREAFHQPIGDMLGSVGGPCLDVACGEGWLSERTSGGYLGIDGSAVAIERAVARYPDTCFRVGRFESPPTGETFTTVIFGGVFSVLVRPECYVELIERYRKAVGMTYFIIYDLETLATLAFDETYTLVCATAASAEVDGLQEIKKHRKMRLYRC